MLNIDSNNSNNSPLSPLTMELPRQVQSDKKSSPKWKLSLPIICWEKLYFINKIICLWRRYMLLNFSLSHAESINILPFPTKSANFPHHFVKTPNIRYTFKHFLQHREIFASYTITILLLILLAMSVLVSLRLKFCFTNWYN